MALLIIAKALSNSVADATDGWLNGSFFQALRVFARQILAAPVAAIDEAAAAHRPAVTDRLFTSVSSTEAWTLPLARQPTMRLSRDLQLDQRKRGPLEIEGVGSHFGVRIQFEQNQCFMLSHFS